jgi:hypothetical protein
MNPDQAFEVCADDVYAILWTGALLLAVGGIADLFPESVLHVAAAYFRRSRPQAVASADPP